MSEQRSAPPGVRVAVVGASGAAGGDITAALGRSPLPVTGWRLFGSRGGPGGEVELRGRSVPIEPLDEDGVARGAFAGVDLVILAVPAARSQALGPALVEEGIAVIDVGAHLRDKGALCLPLSGVADWELFAERRIASVPAGPAAMLGAIAAPLGHLGLTELRGTVMVSAGAAGRAGPEELSRQVIAMFNQAEPPRRVFPQGLAFDVLASPGEAEGGWSAVERALAIDLGAITRAHPVAAVLNIVQVPIFAGMAATLQLKFSAAVDAATVGKALGAMPLVSLSERPPGPRRLVGTTGVHIGRLRDDPLGQGVHLWAAADNLRMGASANVVATALTLWREGLL
ncbi:MAG: hypothetical protein RL071_4897 [Pseudomonadota bacterium]